MKYFITLASILFVGTVAGNGIEGSCTATTSNVCKVMPVGSFANCNAQFGAINHVQNHFQKYARQQLTASYDYLLLGTFYNTYQRDRPGFAKLFRSLSDEAFENSIKLIKHHAKRGGKGPFRVHTEVEKSKMEKYVEPEKILNFDELQSLAKALDIEKDLSKMAIEIHGHSATHNQQARPDSYDPEITQFLEEEFLEKQATTIRKLAGYANDLHKIVDKVVDDKGVPSITSTALGVYLFDEYLQKQ